MRQLLANAESDTACITLNEDLMDASLLDEQAKPTVELRLSMKDKSVSVSLELSLQEVRRLKQALVRAESRLLLRHEQMLKARNLNFAF